VLLAGAGAVGSESLKILSLMGVGCHKRGCVNVADDDRVELSNLNR
jgi:molybdopterin/thiamine biosynthesis adenylyltransferase